MKIFGLFFAAFIACITMLFVPGQASAQACQSDACLWSDDNYSGIEWAMTGSSGDSNSAKCIPLPGQVRSVFNNARMQLMLSATDSCGGSGPYVYVSPGEAVPALGFSATYLSWCPNC